MGIFFDFGEEQMEKNKKKKSWVFLENLGELVCKREKKRVNVRWVLGR